MSILKRQLFDAHVVEGNGSSQGDLEDMPSLDDLCILASEPSALRWKVEDIDTDQPFIPSTNVVDEHTVGYRVGTVSRA